MLALVSGMKCKTEKSDIKAKFCGDEQIIKPLNASNLVCTKELTA